MELNIKFDEKMIVETANRVLDEYEYNGKTIREWADLIANPKTNADRIRSMSDEELAEWIADKAANHGGGCCAPGCNDCSIHPDGCPQAWLEWLREEVKE